MEGHFDLDMHRTTVFVGRRGWEKKTIKDRSKGVWTENGCKTCLRYDLRLKLTASPKTCASVFETIKHNHVNVREAYRNEILSNKTISRTRTFFLREKLGISSVCTSQMIVTHFVPGVSHQYPLYRLVRRHSPF